jgi:hypothetical protein
MAHLYSQSSNGFWMMLFSHGLPPVCVSLGSWSFSFGKTCDAQSFSLQTQVVKSDGGGFAIRVFHLM